MLYLNKSDINNIGVVWPDVIEVIRKTCGVMCNGDYVQPIKQYLRYGNKKNRIIAMPAFIGGENAMSGIKWIASFPDNISSGLSRANSMTILNKASTGEPIGVINTSLISGIRTAAVSGLIISYWLKNNNNQNFEIGITGAGPIGKLHVDMLFSILGDRIKVINVFDIRPFLKKDISSQYADKIRVCKSWEEAFLNADIFLTCTVSEKPYINKKPKAGSLHLNVSLRDYEASWRNYADIVVVDDWNEVCREKTDIEMMHLEYDLQKEQTYSILDIVSHNGFKNFEENNIVFFNPMGMSVFDIAIGEFYLNKAKQNKIGLDLL